MKGLFANRSVLFQSGILLYLIVMGVVLSSIFGYAIAMLSNFLSGNSPEKTSELSFYTLHATQFVSNIFVFILPSIGTAYFCSQKPAEFLHMQKITDIRVIILTTLMIFLISPAIDIATYLNSTMSLPEFMAPIENWMRETEDYAAGITEKILSEKGILPFVTNIFIIGIMAGVTEEFLFRGALLSIIRKKIKNPHIAIWIVAIIFSAIHFQFFGFIPRMLLGAILGYLLYWSNSIWIPVFAHFLNNAMAVVGYKIGLFENPSESSTLITTNIETSELIVTITVAITGVVLFALCAKTMKRICLSPEKS